MGCSRESLKVSLPFWFEHDGWRAQRPALLIPFNKDLGGAGVPACQRQAQTNGTKGNTMTRNKFKKEPVGQASVPVTTEENKELVGQPSLPALNKEQVSVYKRKLPHWRQAGAVYFVTWRLHPSQPELAPDERTLVVKSLEHFQKERYILFAHVIMGNHVHVLVRPFDEYELQAILHSWKSVTAFQIQRQFGRQGAIWQDEYFDRIVRDEAEFLEKAQYILNNPRKRWPELEEYPWVGYFDDASY